MIVIDNVFKTALFYVDKTPKLLGPPRTDTVYQLRDGILVGTFNTEHGTWYKYIHPKNLMKNIEMENKMKEFRRQQIEELLWPEAVWGKPEKRI